MDPFVQGKQDKGAWEIARYDRVTAAGTPLAVCRLEGSTTIFGRYDFRLFRYPLRIEPLSRWPWAYAERASTEVDSTVALTDGHDIRRKKTWIKTELGEPSFLKPEIRRELRTVHQRWTLAALRKTIGSQSMFRKPVHAANERPPAFLSAIENLDKKPNAVDEVADRATNQAASCCDHKHVRENDDQLCRTIGRREWVLCGFRAYELRVLKPREQIFGLLIHPAMMGGSYEGRLGNE